MYPWKYIPRESTESQSGAQIDLVFDRNDGVVNLGEIKYSKGPYIIDKDAARDLLNKANVYRNVTKTNKLIFISLITTFGLKQTVNSEKIVASLTILEDLFKEDS